eukprot:TRINITY_DN24281_c0_g1_i1.p2 TRINITY_DN24281_c0_g1~~TRINITY_DN24281_c0_g1_i1.p2  ORF type:complete len:147 (-),score=23.50 TRINITY_DN24281_c0_g1_i1:49-489(-)
MLVPEHGLDDLVDGGDAGASGKQAYAAGMAGFAVGGEGALGEVVDVAQGALDVYSVVEAEGVEVLGHEAALWEAGRGGDVDLDDEVEEARGVGVGGGGGVGPHDELALDGGAEEDVFPDWQAEDVVRSVQGEAQADDVVANVVFVG